MRLPILLLIGLGSSGADAAQGQATPKCDLPPPLICPPDPPPGPKTVQQLDNYIKGLDATISQNSSAQASAYWPFSNAATSEINSYVEELIRYRGQVADYRNKIVPQAAVVPSDGPE